MGVPLSFLQMIAPRVQWGCGSLPKWSKCGDTRLVAFSILLIWKLISARRPGHAPIRNWWSNWRHLITCFTCPMFRSAIPSHCGWYGVLDLLSTPALAQNSGDHEQGVSVYLNWLVSPWEYANIYSHRFSRYPVPYVHLSH